MRLIGHIVKKDLRRFWFGIVFLVGIVALKFFLADAVFHLALPPRDWNRRLQLYQQYLLLAQLVLSFALAAGIVQEDSVPDSGALCQTLPITRGQLLRAKVLGIVLVCVLPVVLTLSAGWVLLGLPASQLGWPLAVSAWAQLGLGLLALALGSLTKNAGHLLFWMLGVVFALVIPGGIIGPMLQHAPVVTPGTRLTHSVMAQCIWITAGLAVMLNQYLGRSRKRSIVFVGAGVFLPFWFVATGETRLSLDLASTHFPAQRELDARIARLGVSIVRAEVVLPKSEADDSLPAVMLRGALEEPSRGLLIAPRGFYGAWPISALVPFDLHLPRINDLTDLKQVAERELGFHADPDTDRLIFGVGLRFARPGQHPWDRSPAPFQGQIDLSVFQTSLDGELPLTKGASLRSTAGTTRILGVVFDGSIINVDLEERFSAMGVDPGWFPGLEALASPVARRNFALVNRRTKTVLTPSVRNSVVLSSYAYGADLGHAWLAYTLPKAAAGAGGPADWVLVEVSMGEGHRSIRSFETNVSFQQVPAITHDPALYW